MLLQRILNIPFFFLIEERCSARIAEILLEHNLVFRKPLIITGSSRTSEIAESLGLDQLVPNAESVRISSNSFDEVRALRGEFADRATDLAIAVGGGKVIDVVKLTSCEHGIPFLAVPTTLSNDGIGSPVAVLHRTAGAPTESVGAQMPLGVIIDLALVRQAPIDALRAGAGDLVSNFSALEDWRYASRVAGERIDTFAMLLANTAAETVIHYVQSRQGDVDIRSEAFLTRLGEGLILSGLAMEIAGSSRPCSGAEHLVSHALDRLLPDLRPHGIQVGVATLHIERMRGKDPASLESVYRKLGIPTSFDEIGIKADVLAEAIRIGPTMRPGRRTILDEIRPGSSSDVLARACDG